MPYKDPEKRRESQRIRSQRYRARHPEKIKEVWRRWREQNLDYDRARCRQYREDNLEAVREVQRNFAREWRAGNPGYSKEQYARNPERFKAKVRKRQALRLVADAEHIDSLAVLERDDGVCGICGDDVDPFDFHVDHIIPLARGGSHTYDNVQAAHPLCNARKRHRLPEELAA